MSEQPCLIIPALYPDSRGAFSELWRVSDLPFVPVQCNYSRSMAGVLRGLHYQVNTPQAKIIRCISGSILSCAVDLRQSSAMFGRHEVHNLTPFNRYEFYIPAGFAHGFYALENSEIEYITSAYYSPQDERTIIWNDIDLEIDWKISGPVILSDKDAAGVSFVEAQKYA